MREVVKSVDCNCCKVEIFFPSLSKQEIDFMVQFLYTGKISNLSANRTVISKVLDNLTKLLGFPNCLQSTKGTPVVPIFMKETKTVQNVFQELDSVSIKQRLASKSADHKLCPKSQEELNQKHELKKITDIISEKDEVKDQYQNSCMDLTTTYSPEKQVEFDEKIDFDENVNFDEKVHFDEKVEIDQKNELDKSMESHDIDEDTNDALDEKGNENIIQEKVTIKFEELKTTNDINTKKKDGLIECIDTLEPLHTSSHTSDQTETYFDMKEIHEEKVSVEAETKSADLFDLSEDQLKVETIRKPKEFHKGKLVKSYKCNYCNVFYSNRGNLKKHQIASCAKGFIPQADPMELKCSRCNYRYFSTQSELDEHITLVHEGKSKKSFECDHCHKFCSTKGNLSKHILRSCSSESKSTTPKPCGNQFELTEVLDDPMNEKSNRTESDSDQKEIHAEVSVKTERKPAVDMSENLPDGDEELKVETIKKPEKFKVNPESHKHTSACYSSKWSNQNSNSCPLIKDPLLNFQKHCEVSDDKESNKTLEIQENSEVENQTHECEYCFKTFRKNSSLNRHIIMKSCKNVPKTKRISKRLESSETFHQCSKCNLSFSKKSDLIQHQKEKHEISKEKNEMFNKKENEKKMFKCKYCEKVIANRFNLWKHLQKACTSDPNRFELLPQMRIGNVTAKKYKCKYCNKSFVGSFSLKRHLRQVCTSDPNRFDLVSHMKIENVEPDDIKEEGTIDALDDLENGYKCYYCNTLYSSKSNLKKHQIRSCKKEEMKIVLVKRYKCKYCNITFVGSSGLRRHLRQVCTSDPNRFELVPQMKIENVTILRFQCKKCDRSYSTKGALKNHNLIHEGIPKKYDCSLCDKKFVSEAVVDQHILAVHEGKKPHLCSQCGHSSANKSNLKMHIEHVHEGKKPFPCDQCNKKYRHRWELKHHVSRFHEKNKPFKCSICSRCFANISELNQHGDVHTNIRPYPCTICEDKFKRSHHLVTHLKTIHNVAKKDWKI